MTKIIKLLCSIGILALPLSLSLPVTAQSAVKKVILQTKGDYEDDRVKFVLQGCNRQQEDILCQGILTNKKNDRIFNFNLSNIKIVDFEGNEYYPNSLQLANRSNENNSLTTELVANIDVKTTLVFPKIPTAVNKIALLQIPLNIDRETMIAKFRSLTIASASTAKSTPTSTATSNNQDLTLICPDTTKILYRGTTKKDLLYICGGKNPTHFVSYAKDGSMGMTLRLRYYDKQRFSADRGDVNYAIVGNKFIVTKDSKVISQDQISVIQPLAGSTETKPSSKTKQPTNTTKVTKKSTPAKPAKLRSTPAKKKTVTPKQEK